MERRTTDFRTEFNVDAAEAIAAEARTCKAVSIIGQTMQMKHPGLPTYYELAAIAVRNLADAGLEIVPKTVMGNVFALTPAGEDAIRKFVDAVDMTQEAITSGGDALERQFDADPDRYLRAVPGLTNPEVEHSFAEPLDAGVPDHVEDLQAQAVRRVIEANRLLGQAVVVLGPEAVDVMMHHLAAPDLTEAA